MENGKFIAMKEGEEGADYINLPGVQEEEIKKNHGISPSLYADITLKMHNAPNSKILQAISPDKVRN